MQYKRIEKPAGGWCSEMHKPSAADKAVGVLLALAVGTMMIPFYIIKSYMVAFNKIDL